MKKIIEIIKKKWLKDTFLTVILIAIIFAIYFGINYGVKKLNVEDIDLTTDKIYSISESTKTKLGNLEKDVQIQLINLGDYVYLLDFTNKYTQLNSHITMEQIDDLNTRPDIMNTYELQSTDRLIIIKSGERETTLSLYDLYTYDYTTYEQIDITEEAITNAIIEVTIEDKPKIYFLEGHNYYDDYYFQLLKQDMQSESNEVLSLNLLIDGSVPDDCDCLVITTLKEDLTEMEKDLLVSYSNQGGKILLLADSNILGIETPNFNAFLDLYGFSISSGILMEQDTSKMMYGAPEFVISQIDSSVLNAKTKMNMSICVITSGKIDFKDEETRNNLGVTYQEIAKTSDIAFLRTNLKNTSTSKSNQDIDSPNSIIGALVTRTLEDENKAEMIVYANALFATNQQISMNNNYSMYANKLCNNDDVVMNSISYLTQRTDTITIRKDADNVTYNVTTQEQHNIIMAIIFIVPILIIVVGIVVWQIRRRKK